MQLAIMEQQEKAYTQLRTQLENSEKPPVIEIEEPVEFVRKHGTLNQDRGYEHQKERLVILPDAIRLLSKAASLGFGMVVATNQGGVALGKFSMDQSLDFNTELAAKFMKLDIVLSAIYVCFHHPLSLDQEKRKCLCRKPEPGMLIKALLDSGLECDNALMIGDQDTDAQAAKSAGIGFRKIGNGALWESATKYIDEF
jgi:D-glycero-D-manno-heptose 1,7-bisphosphate phosphatase